MSEHRNINDEIHIRQLEEELKARERLAAAAEHEIERVWEAYAKVTKVGSIIVILRGVVVGILGLKSGSDFKSRVQKATEDALPNEVVKMRAQIVAELERQFATTNIQEMIAQKAKEQIDTTAKPLVSAILASNVFPSIVAASNRIESLQSNILTAETILKNFFENSKTEQFDFSQTNNLVVCTNSGDRTLVAFRLSAIPIHNSLRLQYGVFTQPPGSYWNNLNVVFFSWGESLDNLRGKPVFASYVEEHSSSNLFRSITVKGGIVYGDSVPLLDLKWLRVK